MSKRKKTIRFISLESSHSLVKNRRFSLFSSFSLMTVRNSKSDLHRSYWRYMSHEPLLQISTRSDHGWSGIRHLMKSGHDEKNLHFSLFSSFSLKTVALSLLSCLPKVRVFNGDFITNSKIPCMSFFNKLK